MNTSQREKLEKCLAESMALLGKSEALMNQLVGFRHAAAAKAGGEYVVSLRYERRLCLAAQRLCRTISDLKARLKS